MVLCCNSPRWTTVYQTCMRCLTPGWEATRCRVVGNTACTKVRALGTDTVNPSRCTIRPAWSRLGLPASTTLAHTLVALLFIRASFAAWRFLLVISTISLNISLRSNLNSRTCSGCKGCTGKVWRPNGDCIFGLAELLHVHVQVLIKLFLLFCGCLCGLCVKNMFYVFNVFF